MAVLPLVREEEDDFLPDALPDPFEEMTAEQLEEMLETWDLASPQTTLSDAPPSPGVRSLKHNSHSPNNIQLTPSSAYSSLAIHTDGYSAADGRTDGYLTSPGANSSADGYVLVTRRRPAPSTPQGGPSHLTTASYAPQGQDIASSHQSRAASAVPSQGDAHLNWTSLDSDSTSWMAGSQIPGSQGSSFTDQSPEDTYGHGPYLLSSPDDSLNTIGGVFSAFDATTTTSLPMSYAGYPTTGIVVNTSSAVHVPMQTFFAAPGHGYPALNQQWRQYEQHIPGHAAQISGAFNNNATGQVYTVPQQPWPTHPMGLNAPSHPQGQPQPQVLNFQTTSHDMHEVERHMAPPPPSIVPSQPMRHPARSTPNVPLMPIATSSKADSNQATSVRMPGNKPLTQRQIKQRGGRQRGMNLTEPARQKSHNQRKIGACWLCALQRDPCDGGSPCTRCHQRMQRGQPLLVPCDRSKLTMLVHDFLPQSMTSMHQKQTIEDDVAKQVGGWDKHRAIDVALTCGYGPALRWRLYEFRPKSGELLEQLQFKQDANGRSVFSRKYSPPFGILELNSGQDDVHFEDFLDRALHPEHLWEFGWTCFEEEAQVDEFQPRLLQAICELYVDTEDYDLRDHLKHILRMMLITYIMGHTLTLDEQTRNDVLRHVRHSPAPDSLPPHTSPRLANRQLKFFFAILRNKIYDKILNWQQQTMHSSRDKEGSWLSCFCATLGFAMVLEEIQRTIQIQADAKAEKQEMPYAEAMTEASNACERIDKRYDLLVGLFQTKYRSKKWTRGTFGNSTPTLEEPAQVHFAKKVRSLLEEKAEHLRTRQKVTFSQENQCLYTSRLVARFLLPFLALPA